MSKERAAPDLVGRPTARRRAGGGVNWKFELLFAAATLAAVALILLIVFRLAGWPIGQAFGNYLLLVRIYAVHFRHLDFFPVWSSSDAYGMGTPVLLYYHKTYFYSRRPSSCCSAAR